MAAIPARDNAGTLAHRAMQTWIHSDGHVSRDPVGAMRLAIDTVIAEEGREPRGWALTSARLRARVPELVKALTADQPQWIICEGRLADPTHRLHGTPDVVAIGDRIAIIDLKLETLTHDVVSERVAFQLTVYAHLVEYTHGVQPSRVEVFSLNRGRLSVEVTRGSVHEALAAVAAARASDPADAHPSPDACRYCTRRFSCAPHWAAAITWPEADCVEGVVARVEQSATGVLAVLLNAREGLGWLTGIPASALSIAVGSYLRAIRVSTAVGDGTQRWRWTSAADAATVVL